MKLTRFGLVLAVLALCYPPMAQAQQVPQALCPEQKNARVDVRWHSEAVKYDTSQGYADLGGHHIDSKNPYGVHVATDVGGLMTGKITYATGTEINSLRFPSSGATCLWIGKVVVDIALDPTIAIAAENARGSCKYIAILEHESKHVAIDRGVVEKYLNSVRMAASEAVQKVGMVGPKPDGTEAEFKKKMSGYIEGQVKAAMDEMYAERIRRQQALDSRDEYDRVDQMCPKEPVADAPAE